MLFGFEIQPLMLVSGGLTAFVVLIFQVLVGMRKIKFQGRLHLKIHKYAAWVLLGLSALHGIGGLIYVFGWGIG